MLGATLRNEAAGYTDQNGVDTALDSKIDRGRPIRFQYSLRPISLLCKTLRSVNPAGKVNRKPIEWASPELTGYTKQ